MNVRSIAGTWILGAVVLAAAAAQDQAPAAGTQATLSVEKIHATPTLQKKMEKDGKGDSIGRVTEAFDTQLMDRLNA